MKEIRITLEDGSKIYITDPTLATVSKVVTALADAAPVVHKRRSSKGKEIEVMNLETNVKKVYPNLTLACKAMKRGNSYLSKKIAEGIFSDKEYLWRLM